MAGTVSLMLIFGFGSACFGTERPTSLLLITIDTLRADHVSAYGYPRQTTPSIDQLASEGVLFSNTFASRAETWPSLTSLLTSLHPQTHGVRENGDARREQTHTITESLRDAGFRTAAFLTNMTTAEHPGFDHIETWGVESWIEHGQHGADALAAEAAASWISEHAGERFFVWVHLIGPHDPYDPPPGRERRFPTDYRGKRDGSRAGLAIINNQRLKLPAAELAHIVSLYDEEVANADEQVGSLLRRLESEGLVDDTLVALTGDHGEELYDHAFYFLHSWSIHDSVLRVPLVLRLPGRVPAGRRVEGVVENIDIAPTLLELLDLEIPESFAGRGLESEITGSQSGDETGSETGRAAKAGAERAAISELGPEIFSLRTSRWRFIYNPKRYTSPAARQSDNGHHRYFRIGTEELYDLQADPSAQNNVAAEHPQVVRALREQLLSRRSPPPAAPATPIDPDTERELRALGYLGLTSEQ